MKQFLYSYHMTSKPCKGLPENKTDCGKIQHHAFHTPANGFGKIPGFFKKYLL
jgi:hypothetical protein